MVAPHHRDSLLGVQLCGTAFGIGVAKGVSCALMDCNEHLLPFFARLGWKVEGAFEHPEYGWVFTHSLDLVDTPRLRRLRSPFVRQLRHDGNEAHSDAPIVSRAMVNDCELHTPIENPLFPSRVAA